ncbi:MAG TPA: DNA-protecting protein DprA [Clostridiales bacterium]|nr:DNA-protecting protein DprA [Clostridiales bacterium]
MDRLSINQKTIAWLNSAKGISNKKIEKLVDYFNGSPEYIWDNFETEKFNLSILKPETISSLINTKNSFEERLLKRLDSEKASLITIYDECYPKRLREIEGAPAILYYKGTLEEIDNLSISVVGSRKATSYGKWAAEKLTSELAAFGVNIVSGLAAGIDSVAHKAALKSGTKTVGIIGCGIDVIYPKFNEKLYAELAEKGGAVITEYPFGMQPMPNNFHDRNRIISGLSDGVLIIEAQEKSGTLITAGHAANQGKEIFAVPGNIDSLYSRGTNSLIRDGAKLTTSVEDIIEEIPELREKSDLKSKYAYYQKITGEADENEIKIIDCLRSGSRTAHEIIEELRMDAGKILSMLTMLEMKGVIIQITGGRFTLR